MLTPSEITLRASQAGERKALMARQNAGHLLVSAIVAGAFIAFGGILSVIVGKGFPGLAAENPGLARFMSGAVFPIGLILVVVLGVELFTGNNAMLIPSFMARKHSCGDVLRNWAVVYVGNFIGAVAFAYFMVYLCGLTTDAPYDAAVRATAQYKVYGMSWGCVLLKGIGANWCVCLALWLAMASKASLLAKMAGCWFPVMMFVALGYEHSIANMFFIPVGMFEGADINIIDALWRNLVPATLGNIIGGALLVGMLHTSLHPAQAASGQKS